MSDENTVQIKLEFKSDGSVVIKDSEQALTQMFQTTAAGAEKSSRSIQDSYSKTSSGVDAAAARMQTSFQKMMQGVQSTIDTKGMTSLQKEIHAVDQRYNGMVGTLKTVDLASEQHAFALGKINAAREVELAGLQGEQQALGQSISMYSRVNSSIENWKSSLLDIGIALYGLKKAWDLVNAGATLEKQEDAFRNLCETYNIGADSLIADLRRVSKETVDDSDIMQIAGKAMMMGLDPGQLVQFMEIARATTKLTGESAKEAFEGITQAVSSTMTRSLKLRGIIIDQNDAFSTYGATIGKTAAELNELDRQQAIANATITQGQAMIARMGESTDSYSTKLGQWKAMYQEWGDIAAVVAMHVFQGLTALLASAGVAVNAFAAGITGTIWAILQAAENLPLVGKYFKIAADAAYSVFDQFNQAADAGIEFTKTNFDLAFSLDSVGAKARAAKSATADMVDIWNKQSANTGIQTVNPFAKMYGEADVSQLRNQGSNFWKMYTADAAAALPPVKANEEALKKMGTELERWRDIVATSGMTAHEAAIYKINTQYENNIKELGTMVTAEALATAKRAQSIEITKANTDALREQDNAFKAITGSAEEYLAKRGLSDVEQKVYDINKRYAEGTTKLQEQYEATKDLEGAQDKLTQSLAVLDKEKEGRISDAYVDDQKDQLKKQEDNYKSMYDGIASTAQTAFAQIGNSADSMLESVWGKFKNWLASMAAQMVASLSMSTLGSLAGMIGLGGGAGETGGGGFSLGGLFGMGGGGGQGGGMNLMSLLSGGKTAYSTYNSVGGFGGAYNSLRAGYAPGTITTDAYGNITNQLTTNWLGVGAGAVGVGAGGYGMYQAYKSGSPGGGAISGAGAGLGAATMIGAMGYGASLGSWLPGLGTVIGAAVGAAIGYLGSAAAKAEQKEQRLAADYYRGVGRAANADISNMTLTQYTAGGSSVLSKKAVAAAISVGGVDSKTGDEMYRVLEISKAYQKAIEESGPASAQAIGQYQRVRVELEALRIKAAGATGASRDLLNQFIMIAEKTKTLQIKQLTTDLQQGIGGFSTTVLKLREVGIAEKELDSLIATEGLKFLTTDTLPALTGELTKVREEFKAATEAMRGYQEQTDAAAIKQRLLLSDMELTEAQLRTIKYGDVNTDLINLNNALGLTDEKIVLISANSGKQVSAWRAISDASKQLQGDLANIAKQYEGMEWDKIPEAAKKTYNYLTALAAELELIGTAGEKFSALPDLLEEMNTALSTGDVATFSDGLLQVGDTVMYLTQLFELMNMAKIAALIGPIGKAMLIGAEVLKVGEAIGGMFQDATRKLAGNEDIYNWMVDNLSKFAEKYPKIAEFFGISQVLNPEDVPGTSGGEMTYDDAVKVGAKYAPQNPTTIFYDAIAAIQKQNKSYEKDGIATYEEGLIAKNNLLIEQLQNGLETVIDGLTKAFDDILKNIQDYKTSLTLSKYNVFANPQEMAQNYASDYQSHLSAFNGSDATNLGQNWTDLQGSAQQYLDYMLQQYGPTQTYQDVYRQVMAMLDSAQGRVKTVKNSELSKYETQAVTAAETTATKSVEMANSLKLMTEDNKAIKKALAAIVETIAATPKQIGKEVAMAQPYKK